VDVSAMETMTVAQIHSSLHHQLGQTPARRESPLVRTQDGWVSPGLERGVRADTWPRVCELIGRSELADNPKFSTPEVRREHQQELLSIIGEWAAARPKEEIYHTLQKLQSVAGYVATVADLFSSEQLQARAFFRSLHHPDAGDVLYPGAAFTLQGEAWKHARAPRLGEHNLEVYIERLGYTREELLHLHGAGAI
jgi:formyl-CoA transferase